jgi:hypothetical protein
VRDRPAAKPAAENATPYFHSVSNVGGSARAGRKEQREESKKMDFFEKEGCDCASLW